MNKKCEEGSRRGEKVYALISLPAVSLISLIPLSECLDYIHIYERLWCFLHFFNAILRVFYFFFA